LVPPLVPRTGRTRRRLFAARGESNRCEARCISRYDARILERPRASNLSRRDVFIVAMSSLDLVRQLAEVDAGHLAEVLPGDLAQIALDQNLGRALTEMRRS
jgi:hypothetical protein